MDRSIFGWDLPPGVRVSDIPGNRPEDAEWEAILQGFWEKKGRNEEIQKALEDAPEVYVDLIDEAIEYGIDIGIKQAKAIEEENKFLEEQAKAYEEEKVATIPDGLLQYVNELHQEPYKALTNNCIHKNLKLARKASEMGLNSILVFTLAQTPAKIRWFYPWNPHLILLVNGIELDLFYAKYWHTERVTKGRIKLWKFKAEVK